MSQVVTAALLLLEPLLPLLGLVPLELPLLELPAVAVLLPLELPLLALLARLLVVVTELLPMESLVALELPPGLVPLELLLPALVVLLCATQLPPRQTLEAGQVRTLQLVALLAGAQIWQPSTGLVTPAGLFDTG